DDVTSILRDKRWHSAAGRIPELMGVTDEAFLSRQRVSILSAEGDVHLRLRRLVAPAFSPRQADRLRPFMREVIDGLVDKVSPAGRADIAIDICEPYPIPIICELLGAPKGDWQLFSRWANDILEIFSVDMADKLDLITRTQDELDAYTRELIAERRDKPADDLLTDLIAMEEAGDRLSTDELVMMVNAVIVGGTDTTRNQLGCAMGLFAEHPDQWALLAERPDLAQRAVEETMRYFGAVRGTARFASVDIEYRDIVFPAGTFMSVGLAEANRDPGVFQEPATFDITSQKGEQPQLTFGSGIHYCLGQALARAELQEALPLLARRMPNLRLDGPTTWKPEGVGIFGPAHMPVAFDPGH
ncbi:MAG: cytochrome P450, partial [Actinomycetota bacterium]|nr:cytochrome P450 [Actinomycetota bacterium]